MTMHPESRKRAVEVMTNGAAKDSIATIWAENYLERLLAAGFHVAEWRKVEDAPLSDTVLVNIAETRENFTGHQSSRDFKWYLDGCTINGTPAAIMDLPEPPKNGEVQ